MADQRDRDRRLAAPAAPGSTLVTVAYDDGETETYQVPLVSTPSRRSTWRTPSSGEEIDASGDDLARL